MEFFDMLGGGMFGNQGFRRNNFMGGFNMPQNIGIGGGFINQPSLPEGLLSTQAAEDLRKRSIGSGLLNAIIGYAAMPKNENLGLGRILAGAAQQGLAGARGVYGQAGQDLFMQQRLEDMKRTQAKAVREDEQQIASRNAIDMLLKRPEIANNPMAVAFIQSSPAEALKMLATPKERKLQTIDNQIVDLSGDAPKVIFEGKPKIDDLTNLINIRDKLEAENPNNPNIKRYDDRIDKLTKFPPSAAPVTNVNMPFESNFQKALGTKVAEAQLGEYETANKAANNIQKIDLTLNQIQNSDATTGLGAEVINNVNRFRSQFLADAKAGKKVADTQILDAFLGSDVFPLIGALGIGARGLDTPAEREFLRQVMTGTINMDKAALVRMTKIRRDVEKRAIDKYNKGVKQGRYDRFFDATGYAKEEVSVPEAPELKTGTGGFSIKRIR